MIFAVVPANIFGGVHCLAPTDADGSANHSSADVAARTLPLFVVRWQAHFTASIVVVLVGGAEVFGPDDL